MEIKLMYILITGIIGIIASVITFLLNFRQAKQIEKLKLELDQKRQMDNQKFTFLLDFHSERIMSYLKHSEKYITIVQEIKSEIRELVKRIEMSENKDNEDILSKIRDLKQQINFEYSNSTFVFNKIDKFGTAHKIKNLIIDVLDDIQKQETKNKISIENTINEISEKQKELQDGVEKEIDTLLTNLEIK